MMKLKHLSLVAQTVLTALILVGCQWNEDPVRQSLDVDTSDLVLTVGQSASRPASTESKVFNFIYTTSTPSVALVDQNGLVTAMSEGEAVIKVHMDETREGWYAAADREYKVIVKGASAAELQVADKSTPMTLVAQADGKISVNFNGGITLSGDIYYSINGGALQTISRNTKGSYDITVVKGDLVQFYSTNAALSSDVVGVRAGTRGVTDGAKYVNIKPSMNTEIYGNLMSLLSGKDKYKGATAIEGAYAFYGLFAGAENLVNNHLRHVELPATTLTEGCYQAMFYGCKGLQRISELPANTLTKNCYKEMFADCSKLSYVRSLASGLSEEGCTNNWLANAGSEVTSEKIVASVTPFPADSNDGTPASWTNLVLTPVDKVTLNTTNLVLGWGDKMSTTATLTATVSPAYSILSAVYWSSSDESVATVSSSGVVTVLNPGNAVITASAGGKSAKCNVSAMVVIKETDLSTLTGDYQASTGEILKGKLSGNYKITIPDNAMVCLQDVTINGTNSSSCPWAGITCLGNAAIILSGTNVVKGFHENYPGIQAAHNTGSGDEYTLTLWGGGKLDASSNGKAPGIGGGYNIACGHIKVMGGDIEATSGYRSASIGGGYQASCGNITISTDVTQVIAKKGADGYSGIGAGSGGSCGTVTVGGKSYSSGGISTTPYGYPILDLSYVSDDISEYKVYNDLTITGSSESLRMKIYNNATLTLKDVNINKSKESEYAPIANEGNSTIILKGTNKVVNLTKGTAIYAAHGFTLTIKGDGSLMAKGGTNCAGIGGNPISSCGNITISGGDITAECGPSSGYGAQYSAAAIGGAYQGSFGNITITSSVIRVKAIKGSGSRGYCIGKGAYGYAGGVTIGGTNYGEGVDSNQDDNQTYIYIGKGY